MTTKNVTIPAGEFKSKHLKLMDEVNHSRIPIIITKRGHPIAKLVPIKKGPFNIFGCLSGSVTVNGDIIAPIDVKWDADEL